MLCWLKVSSSFAEAASRKKEGEVTFHTKLGDLEQHLKTAEKKLLQSQVCQHTETTEQGYRRDARMVFVCNRALFLYRAFLLARAPADV